MDVAPHLNALTGRIIGAAIEVHRHLGPGLLESTYFPCLQLELQERQIQHTLQQRVALTYKGITVGDYRLDFVVADAVVVELKSVERVLPVHDAQLLTYLRLSGYELGLLINFNVVRLVDGIRRIVNTGTSAAGRQR